MFANRKLGLLAHDPVRLERTPLLSDVASLLFTETPRDWQLGQTWDSDPRHNDWLGCCGTAAVVNWLVLMHKVRGLPLPFDPDALVLDLYKEMGWDGTDATDNGVVLADLLNHCVSVELFDGYVRVPVLSRRHVATACDLGGPLIVGTTLTEACQDSTRWDAKTADDKRIWGRHAVLMHAVSSGLDRWTSWGEAVDVTPDYEAARTEEAYLPLSKELHPNLAIDWDRLQELADLV